MKLGEVSVPVNHSSLKGERERQEFQATRAILDGISKTKAKTTATETKTKSLFSFLPQQYSRAGEMAQRVKGPVAKPKTCVQHLEST